MHSTLHTYLYARLALLLRQNLRNSVAQSARKMLNIGSKGSSQVIAAVVLVLLLHASSVGTEPVHSCSNVCFQSYNMCV